MPRAKYKAVIIGCGQIGALYSRPGDRKGVTHAHAYRQESRVQLVAMADRDQARASRAARLWNVTAYHDARMMLTEEQPDIISICVPDEAHADVLEMCLKFRPRAVFCEKPLTTDLRRAKTIAAAYAKAGVVLAVNFSRRWNPEIIRLRENIRRGVYGKFLNAQAVYTKGILHNGSHMIDLLRYVLGEIADVKALSGRVDWKKTDPSVDAQVTFVRGGTAQLSTGDERCFSVFDLQMLFSKAKISLTNFGEDLTIDRAVADPVWKGCRMLKSGQLVKTHLYRNIAYAVANLVDAVDGKSKVFSPAGEAVATQAVCERILKDYSKRRV